MTAAQPGDYVSFHGMDNPGHFERYEAWKCKHVNNEGSADSTYYIQRKVGQQWCVSKDGFRSLHSNEIVQSDMAIQEKKVYKFLSI